MSEVVVSQVTENGNVWIGDGETVRKVALVCDKSGLAGALRLKDGAGELGRGGELKALAFGVRDGNTVLFAGRPRKGGGKAWLIEEEGSELFFEYTGAEVYGAAFHPESGSLILGTERGVEEPEEEVVFPGGRPVGAVAAGPGVVVGAGMDDGRIRVWLGEGERDLVWESELLTATAEICAVAVVGDGGRPRVVAGAVDGRIWIWDARRWSRLERMHSMQVNTSMLVGLTGLEPWSRSRGGGEVLDRGPFVAAISLDDDGVVLDTGTGRVVWAKEDVRAITGASVVGGKWIALGGEILKVFASPQAVLGSETSMGSPSFTVQDGVEPRPESGCKWLSAEKKAASGVAGKGASPGGVVNKKKVRSSGYGSKPPVMGLFTWKPPTKAVARRKSGEGVGLGKMLKEYPVGCGILNQMQGSIAGHNGAVDVIGYASDGGWLASGGADGVMRVQKMPFLSGSKTPTLYQGGGAITDLAWARRADLVVTGCADGSAFVTRVTNGKRLGSIGVDERFINERGGAVSAVGWFYLDKFVAVAGGSGVSMWRQEQLVARVSMTSNPHEVTGWAGHNGMLSPSMVLCGSNRAVEVTDVYAKTTVRSWEDVCTRPALKVKLDPFGHVPDLFVTAGGDDTVRLWDARTRGGVVRCWSEQIPASRGRRVGLEWSPCGRWIGVGSGNGSGAAICDLRAGVVTEIVGGELGESCPGIGWNPYHPQLTLGCADGRVSAWTCAK